MTELIKEQLKNVPEKVQNLFERIINDERLAHIESYLMYGDSVLYSQFKVKDEVYFNEERYFLKNDIIEFEVGLNEAYENEFPVIVRRIGKIESYSYPSEIDFDKNQLE